MNVLITGAAGGLGRAMAMECGKRGYDLFLTDMDEEALRRVQTGLERRFGVTAAVKACDLTKPESVDVLALCPAGMVTTEKTATAIRAQGVWGAVTTNPLEVVARKTLDRALAGKAIYIPGALNLPFFT